MNNINKGPDCKCENVIDKNILHSKISLLNLIIENMYTTDTLLVNEILDFLTNEVSSQEVLEWIQENCNLNNVCEGCYEDGEIEFS